MRVEADFLLFMISQLRLIIFIQRDIYRDLINDAFYSVFIRTDFPQKQNKSSNIP